MQPLERGNKGGQRSKPPLTNLAGLALRKMREALPTSFRRSGPMKAYELGKRAKVSPAIIYALEDGSRPETHTSTIGRVVAAMEAAPDEYVDVLAKRIFDNLIAQLAHFSPYVLETLYRAQGEGGIKERLEAQGIASMGETDQEVAQALSEHPDPTTLRAFLLQETFAECVITLRERQWEMTLVPGEQAQQLLDTMPDAVARGIRARLRVTATPPSVADLPPGVVPS